jgi:hypothetical protein
MKPRDIAQKIGSTKIESMVDELNSGQFKRILIAGDVSTRIPSSVLSLKARSRLWKDRLLDGLSTGNDNVASALIYEWLLGRRRPMLEKYLDLLEVKHRRGETDETFLKTIPEETLRAKAHELAKDYPAQDVAIYVHFLDHHQHAVAFLLEPAFIEMLAPQAG